MTLGVREPSPRSLLRASTRSARKRSKQGTWRLQTRHPPRFVCRSRQAQSCSGTTHPRSRRPDPEPRRLELSAAATGGKARDDARSQASSSAQGAAGAVGGAKHERGGAGRRKRLEARAVPGCFARRALGSLPPSCWRKRGERQRGPPASRPGQCGPVREGGRGGPCQRDAERSRRRRQTDMLEPRAAAAAASQPSSGARD